MLNYLTVKLFKCFHRNGESSLTKYLRKIISSCSNGICHDKKNAHYHLHPVALLLTLRSPNNNHIRETANLTVLMIYNLFLRSLSFFTRRFFCILPYRGNISRKGFLHFKIVRIPNHQRNTCIMQNTSLCQICH